MSAGSESAGYTAGRPGTHRGTIANPDRPGTHRGTIANPDRPGTHRGTIANPDRPGTHRGTIDYVPALDGLRAVAVAAVIAFHFGVAGTQGGFLGVDVFFVLSGYLITSLLTSEWTASGSISLRSFWGRRARRLFPALAITLVGVSVAAACLDSPDALPGIRSDALSTLFYFANWHFIASSQHYFTHFGLPSPLLHTWSLSVEEQFYLIWPLATLGVITVAKRWERRSSARPRTALSSNALSSDALSLDARSPNALSSSTLSSDALSSSTLSNATRLARRTMIVLCALGGGTSIFLMATGFHPGNDPSRLYYGTDTHAQVILIGALLALLRPSRQWAETKPRRGALGIAGIAGALTVLWAFHSLPGDSPLLYRGGFAVVSIAVAAVIAHVISLPDSPLTRVLALGPVRYIGRISYGLYLYHWPTFTFLTVSSTGLHGVSLLTARLAITFAAAILSFHLVETPIRQGLSGRLSVRSQVAGLLPAGAAVVLATVLIATSLPAAANPVLKTKATLPPGSHPAMVMLVGDSVAMTLGIGLPVAQARFNVQMVNDGTLGCGIAEGNPVRLQGQLDSLPPCNPTTGQTWQQYWSTEIARLHPDVVALELGRWEAVDRMHDGQWMHVGEPAYDAYLTSQLDQAVKLLSSSGAQVALFTAPYYNEPPSPYGTPWPENDPARVDAWNAIVRAVADLHPSYVTVINLGTMLDPGGHFASSVDGVPVRCPDGVHLSWQGGELVAPLILPELARLGALAYQRAGPRTALSPVSPLPDPSVPSTPSALNAQVADRSTSPTCPFG